MQNVTTPLPDDTGSPEAADKFQILGPDGRLIAIYETRKESGEARKDGLKLYPVRVFAENEA